MEENLMTIYNISKQENCSLPSQHSNYSAKLSLLSTPEARAVPAVFALVFICGILGNFTLLYFVLRKILINSPQTVYIMNLAVGDILMISVAMPFVSIVYTLEEWPFGDIICKTSEAFQTLCTSVIIFTITALSIERYLMIFKMNDPRRLTRSKLHIVFIWIFSILIAVPDLISSTVKQYAVGIKVCLSYPPEFGTTYAQSVTVLKFLFLFLLPLSIITLFYVCIILNLGKGMEARLSVQSQGTCDEEEALANEILNRRRITAIIACLIFLFVICWLPRHIYLMWYHFDPGQYTMFWHIFKILGFCLIFINSAANPLVFFLLESRFRRFVVNCYLCQSRSTGTESRAQGIAVPHQTIILTDLISGEKTDAI